MALTDTDVRQDFQGNGATTSFAIPYAWLVPANATVQNYKDTIRVIQRDESTALVPVETVLSYTTHYTFDSESAPANVVFVTAPASTTKIIIKRSLALSHDLNITSNGTFEPIALTRAIDKAYGLIQQLQEQLDRCVQWKETEQFSGTPNLEPIDSSEKVIGMNTLKTALRWWSADELMDIAEGTFSAQFSQSLSNNQSATEITDCTLDVTDWTSAWFMYELKRDTSTTNVAAMGFFRLQYANGAWALEESLNVGSSKATHGVTFTMTESGGVAQMLAATSNMGGTGHSGSVKCKFLRFEA